VVLNQLYRMTQLQTSFPVNFLALNDGRPQQMGLLDALRAFIAFREEVILRRSRHRLSKARERGHLLIGLAIAVANIDEVIRLIRASSDPAEARAALMARDWPAGDVGELLALVEDSGNLVTAENTVRLTEAQARGILALTLQRLTGLERHKITQELEEVGGRIRELLAILTSHPRRMEVMTEELRAVRAQIASPRLTQIVEGIADLDDESLIEPGMMVVTLTRDGYVKRTPLDTFRAQHRGGRGRSAAATRQDDLVVRSFIAHTHQWVLFFTSRGIAFREKVWQLPEGGAQGKGRSLRQVLQLQADERVTAVLPLPQDDSLWDGLHLVFGTAGGNVRRNRLSDFRNVRAAGLIAMKLDDGDELIGVQTCREGDDLLLATRKGRVIRFTAGADQLRVFAGRDSSGVRGIRLVSGDRVIALSVLRHVEATVAERATYLRGAAHRRRAAGEDVEANGNGLAEEGEEASTEIAMSAERTAELEGSEEIIFTVTDGGFGKRSPPTSTGHGPGRAGHRGIELRPRNGREVVATFPVRPRRRRHARHRQRALDPPASRPGADHRPQAMGVTLLRLNDGERVTSCFPVLDGDDDGPGRPAAATSEGVAADGVVDGSEEAP
jgi:DNA gyrase subunit A